MSNSDILSKADKVLRPVLKALSRFSWMRIEGCCAGHKPEDTLWLEINVLGMTGLNRLRELLRILDGKLAGTDLRVDCLLSYAADPEELPVPHGWTPTAVEVFWPPRPEWRRSQSMVIEALLSSIEEFTSRDEASPRTDAAITYCPFCSSSFVRLESIGATDHKYRCGDCDMTWTMTDPVA
jgi:predicted Zn finger-like uncharacterized protein